MDRTIDERVRAVIRQELGIAAHEDIASDQLLARDLGADSMDSYSLVSALEVEFAIEIPDHDIPELQTVRQLVAYVQERVGTVGYGHGV